MRDGIRFQIDDDVDAVTVSCVMDIGYLGQLLIANQLSQLLEQTLTIHLIRDLFDHNGVAAILLLDDLAFRADRDAAMTGLVCIADALLPHDDATSREVRTGELRHQLFGGDLRVVQHQAGRVDRLAQIMRRDVRCHANSDAVRSIDQQIREARREHFWLLQALIIVRVEVHGLFIKIAQELHRRLIQASLGVAHRCCRVAVDGSEVPMTIDQGKAHGERLSQADHRVIDGRVTMRVIFADDVAYGTG